MFFQATCIALFTISAVNGMHGMNNNRQMQRRIFEDVLAATLNATNQAVALNGRSKRQAVDPQVLAIITQFDVAQALTLLDNLNTYGCWCPKASGASTDTLGGIPLDRSIDAACRDYVKCSRCNDFSGCSGDIESYDAQVDIVTLVAGLALDIFTGVPIDQLEIPSSVAVTCDTSLNECTYNKCLCEAEYTLATSFYLVIDLLQGSPTMNNADNHNLDSGTCIRQAIGNGAANACCGTSPSWTLYNTARRTCTNGVLA